MLPRLLEAQQLLLPLHYAPAESHSDSTLPFLLLVFGHLNPTYYCFVHMEFGVSNSQSVSSQFMSQLKLLLSLPVHSPSSPQLTFSVLQ
ncbi:hypothetical protein EVAR_62904_1 [Eumeta japonica]|uniref:Uncharacterized protein n=1 Tax=Eumeta variegata TaxID=151549 RepID=A0A4C1Y6Y0_EUMVA|nr:hypothetical protein EVAR_62904_1 [Eumeta japonica]